MGEEQDEKEASGEANPLLEQVFPFFSGTLPQLGAVDRHRRKLVDPLVGPTAVKHQIVSAIGQAPFFVRVGALAWRDARVELPYSAPRQHPDAALRHQPT